ncbi:MAG: c-type cytochrome [Hyphomonadaceae bacterium]
MGELGFNKFFGALLATLLLILGLNEASNMLFSSGGGHHGGHHYDSQNEWAADKFHGYRIEIAEAASGGSDEPEDLFDLGLMLANADVAAGERAMRQCAQCHTWDDGGANGTGPNLYNIMSADIAAGAGFAYSGALSGVDGDWTYEAMNEWLTNPGAFARGNKMSFAGLRSPRKDAERVNIIAYLASVSPNAAAFPAPLVQEASAEGLGETTDAAVAAGTVIEGTVVEGSETVVTDIVTEETSGGLLERVIEATEDAGGEAVDAAENTAGSIVEELVETVEDVLPVGEH